MTARWRPVASILAHAARAAVWASLAVMMALPSQAEPPQRPPASPARPSPQAAPAAAPPPTTPPAQAAPAGTPAAKPPATADVATPPAAGGTATPPAADATVPPPLPPPSPPLPLPAAPQQAQLPPRIPAKPDDPRASRVYATFDTYCARCHQSGKLEKAAPAAGFGNVLALGELARDMTRVLPGVPDASPLYQVLEQGHAPLSPFGEEGPGADDVTALREWIRELPSRTQTCAGRDPIKSAAVDGYIEEALRAEREGARELRFISLVELYNACVPSDEIAAARQALTKLMNTLSWGPTPRQLRAVDPQGAILSFRLDDFGWVAGHWQTLQAAYPKALVAPLSDKTRGLAGAPNPIVRGDWLADAVSDPKLYYQLLGMPQKLADLAKMNGVEIDTNIRLARARRAIVRTSEITRGNRLIERHPGARGGFWIAYDFASSIGDQDLFERPLGPKVTPTTRTPFKPDALRVLFLLPNGFPAFALYDPAGNRMDRALPGVEKPLYVEGASAGLAGPGCFACHASVARHVRDEYRGKTASVSDPTAPGKDVREMALALAATDGEMLLLTNADNERYRNALVTAGIDPALTLWGRELVTALAQRYRAGTDFAGAAVEMGLDRSTFEAALSKATGPTAQIARRLQQSMLPRAEIDDLFAYLKGVSKPPEPPSATPAGPAPPASAIHLDMWAENPKPALGEPMTFAITTNQDCYLTVINVDVGGKATVLVPNDFEPDNLLSVGKTMRLPSPEAPYQLKRKEKGRELMLAQCSTSPAPPTGVEHEFSRQRFTVLGNWESFVEDAIITEADLRKSPEKAERARAARAASMRRNVGTRGTAGNERADTAQGRKLTDGRAVLVIDGDN